MIILIGFLQYVIFTLRPQFQVLRKVKEEASTSPLGFGCPVVTGWPERCRCSEYAGCWFQLQAVESPSGGTYMSTNRQWSRLGRTMMLARLLRHGSQSSSNHRHRGRCHLGPATT